MGCVGCDGLTGEPPIIPANASSSSRSSVTIRLALEPAAGKSPGCLNAASVLTKEGLLNESFPDGDLLSEPWDVDANVDPLECDGEDPGSPAEQYE